MAGQNTFETLLLDDANMIGEQQETKIKMPNMCSFAKRHFLTWIDLNFGFGNQNPYKGSKVPNKKSPI